MKRSRSLDEVDLRRNHGQILRETTFRRSAGPAGVREFGSRELRLAHNSRMGRGRKWAIGCLTPIVIIGALAVILPDQRNAILNIGGAWWSQQSVSAKHDYSGTSIDNLRRMQTALLLYNDSEGQFPDSSGWMDAIGNRLETADLNKGEAKKKLIRP